MNAPLLTEILLGVDSSQEPQLPLAVEALRKILSTQRSDIAALKRRLQELERAFKALARASSRAKVLKPSASSMSHDNDTGGLRFRAAGMASNRRRLGLSAENFGLLVGATGQSVYSWESGKSKPSASSLAAIAALRGVGKREVVARLKALKTDFVA